MARPAGGYKLANGQRVIGVTTIISRFRESGALLNWAWKVGLEGGDINSARDKAADAGTYAHELIEAHINGLPTPEPPTKLASDDRKLSVQAFESFLEWERHSRLVIVDQEMPLVSEKHKFGGTPDGVGMVTDRLAMIDYKSSRSLYYDYALQLAAYVHLYRETHPDRDLTGGIHIIRFGKAGVDFTHRHIAANHPILEVAWRQFLRLREAYDDDKELKRLFG